MILQALNGLYQRLLTRGEEELAAQLLPELARQGGQVVLARVALAAGLHEDRRPALADQQQSPVRIADHGGHDVEDAAQGVGLKRPASPPPRARSR